MALRRACLGCGKAVPIGQVCACGGQRVQRSSCVECGLPAVRGPYCLEHVPAKPEAQRAAYRQGYRDPAYYRERQATLTRARGSCERCGAHTKLQVDHIVPLRDGGTNTRANLQALCTTCHQAKTAADRRRRRA